MTISWIITIFGFDFTTFTFIVAYAMLKFWRDVRKLAAPKPAYLKQLVFPYYMFSKKELWVRRIECSQNVIFFILY